MFRITLILSAVCLLLAATRASGAITLLTPNGGEIYVIGSQAQITWGGIPATDVVAIDYSSNAGGSWSTITGSASGFSYTWNSIPQPPGNRCQVRVRHLASGQQDVSDGFFVIGAPIVAVSNVVMDPTIVGTVRDSLVTSYVANGGPFEFTVDSIVVRGRDATQFVQRTGFAPFNVRPAKGQDITWRFQPTSVGVKTAEVTVYTGGDALVRTITATGVEIRKGIALALTAIDTMAYTCTPQATDTIVTYNPNSADVMITGLQFTGGGASDFGFPENRIGTRIPAGGSIGIPVSFQRQTPGVSTAQLVAHCSNIPAGDPAIPSASMDVTGRYDRQDISVTPASFTLPGRAQGQVVDTSIVVLNNGTRTETIVVTPAAGVVPTPPSTVLAPGASITVRIRITVDTLRTVPRVMVVGVSRQGCSRNVHVDIATPSARSTRVAVRIGNASGFAGDTVYLPVFLDPPIDLSALGVTGIRLRIGFNATMLQPLPAATLGGSVTGDVVTGGTRTIEMLLPQRSDDTGLLATVAFRVGLGNDSLSALHVSDALAESGPSSLAITTADGRFTMLGICLAGGARLVQGTGAVSLGNVLPNPVREGSAAVTVSLTEQGYTSLTLHDFSGQLLATYVQGPSEAGIHRIPMDLQQLASGYYYLVLRTPTEVRTSRVDVVR